MSLFLKNSLLISCTLLSVLLSSCDILLKQTEDKQPLARVEDTFLYWEDIASLLQHHRSPEDSTLFVTNYINQWAARHLLLSKAKINLPEKKLQEFDRLVQEYQAELYTKAYVEALALQTQDATVNPTQLRNYYNKEKENFKLLQKLVQLRFVALPHQFLQKDQVRQQIKRWKASDKTYLDSIAIQFKKAHFNDSIWVSAFRIMQEIPPLTPRNEQNYLKKSKFFELQDSTAVYLVKVNHVLDINDTAPFDYVAPDIKQIILNKRRLEYIKELETDIIDKAIQNQAFEIYEPKHKKNTHPNDKYSDH